MSKIYNGGQTISLISCILLKLNKRCRLRNSSPLSSAQVPILVLESLPNGYRVALGGRNPKPTSDDDAYLNVKVDVQKRESIEEAFDTVVHKLGPMNVFIYNGMSLFFPNQIRNAQLILSTSCVCHSTTRRSPHNSSRHVL